MAQNFLVHSVLQLLLFSRLFSNFHNDFVYQVPFVRVQFVWIVGLSVAGCAPQQFADIAEHESDKKEDPSRDIMLVIAGGEGYVDFRRGIELVFLTF